MELILPTSIIVSSILAFVVNYFTLNKKIAEKEEKLKNLEKIMEQVVEEIKDLRKLNQEVYVHSNKIDNLSVEVEYLKKLNDKLQEVDKKVERLEVTLNTKFDTILEKLNSIT